VIVPCPDPADKPFNEPVTEQLNGGEQLTATFTPEQRTATFRLAVLGISKHPETEYTVRIDDEVVYGPAAVPPTDIDDMGLPSFIPVREMRQSLTVIVTNLSASTARTYTIQPVGWEVV
jgi:hypothetical protein